MDIVRKGEDGTNWESDIDMYTIPCVKQIASGKLLYSPGSSALCDDLEGWGGGVGERYERGDICIQVADSLLYSRNEHNIVKQSYSN